MGHNIDRTTHRTEEAAREAQANAKGVPGYSEVYRRGVSPARLVSRETGEEYDGWISETETYYG